VEPALDEEEKMLLRVIKRRVCGFTSVSEAENQKGRMDEVAMEGL
jgi:hypothetical protein